MHRALFSFILIICLLYSIFFSITSNNIAATLEKPKSIRVGTFNIRSFGKTKIKHPIIVAMLARLVSEFDVLLIQELRDTKNIVMPKFLAWLNKGPDKYAYRISKSLGSKHYKERFAFLFKEKYFLPGKIKIFPNTNKVFFRPPAALPLQIKHNGMKLVFINVHITPERKKTQKKNRTQMEIFQLKKVIQWAVKSNRSNNLIIMGDLNADCSYFNEKQLDNFSKYFVWLTPHNVDTSLGKGRCAYDRIGISRSLRMMYKGKGGIIHFNDKFFDTPPKLENSIVHKYPEWAKLMQIAALKYTKNGKKKKLNAKRISDHFPQWIDLNL